jgi:hypothetical protein
MQEGQSAGQEGSSDRYYEVCKGPTVGTLLVVNARFRDWIESPHLAPARDDGLGPRWIGVAE